MTASRAGVLVAAVCVAVAPAARGDARPVDVTVVGGVRVAGPACPIAPLSVPAFLDSLRVELAGSARPPGSTVVTLAVEPCDAATARVRVRITNDAGGAAAERDVGLEDVALEARPRALALAVAELVRGPQGASPPLTPRAAVSATASPEAPPPLRTGGAADAVWEHFPGRGATLWGARLSLSLDRRRGGLALFGEAASGGHGYELGEVELRSIGGGLVAGSRFSWGRLTLAPAVVGALAWARIEGHAGEPGVVASAGSSLTAALRARVAVSSVVMRVVSVRAFVEAGWMLRGLDATVAGARAAGLAGATFVVGVGVGL
jgi:hypothetical protein